MAARPIVVEAHWRHHGSARAASRWSCSPPYPPPGPSLALTVDSTLRQSNVSLFPVAGVAGFDQGRQFLEQRLVHGPEVEARLSLHMPPQIDRQRIEQARLACCPVYPRLHRNRQLKQGRKGAGVGQGPQQQRQRDAEGSERISGPL